jgi:large subunit ribosomal protein L17
MFRNMVTSLFKHEQIRTTDTKAKELRRWVDQLVTLAKRGDLHARRQAMAIIREKDVVHKLFAEAPERFADVNGGYTRVVKIGTRPGDAAAVSLVQLVSPELKKKKKPRRKKKAAPSAATTAATVTKDASATEAAAGPEAPETEAASESETSATEAGGSKAEAAEAQAPEAFAPETVPEAASQASDAGEKKEEK